MRRIWLVNCLVLLGIHWVVSFQNTRKWSDWYNIDTPDGKGDFELLEEIRNYYTELCPNPVDIEVVSTDVDANTNDVVHESPSRGFECLNSEQAVGTTCHDYKVRFLCVVTTSNVAVEITSDVADDMWLPWNQWSHCDVTCGTNGAYRRTRMCKKDYIDRGICPSEFTETKPCKLVECQRQPSSVTQAPTSTSTKNINDDLFFNTCHTSGRVTDAYNAPVQNVELALGGVMQDTVPGFVLATTNDNGAFIIIGLCGTSAFTQIVARKEGYITSQLHPRINGIGKNAVADVKLVKPEPMYFLQEPSSRTVMTGQFVRLCCRISGNNYTREVEWYHNGDIMQNQADSDFVINSVALDDAGIYHCIGRSLNTIDKKQIQSRKVELIVKNKTNLCTETPLSKVIKLPDECEVKKEGKTSKHFDVGKCPPVQCPGQLVDTESCGWEKETHCCHEVERKLYKIRCKGYTLPISKVIRCGCGTCKRENIEVQGRVTSVGNSSDPLRFGFIYYKNKTISTTSYNGEFSVSVPFDTYRFVLTFEDRFKQLVTTTKVLKFKPQGGVIYHQVKMMKRSEEIEVDGSSAVSIPLKSKENENSAGFIVTQPNSFYIQAQPYTDKVKARVTFIDPNSRSPNESPTDLLYSDDTGVNRPLQTYGMFEVDMRDQDLNEIEAANVQIYVDSDRVSPSKLANFKLWSLNPVSGIWEKADSFKEATMIPPINDDSPKRRKREAQTFLVGNMEIRERRMYNLDVPVENQCWIKVRTYASDHFKSMEQISGVEVTVINLEPMNGFKGNPPVWGRYDSAVTTDNGACIPVFCDETADAYTAHVMASIDSSEELYAAKSTRPQTSKVIGVEEHLLNKLEYKRSDHNDPLMKKTSFTTNLPKPTDSTSGPLYKDDDYQICEDAAVNDNHFRFFQSENYLYEYNTVFYDESDCMTWTPNYLNWWPKPNEYRACYMKIRIAHDQPHVVRTKSLGGTHPVTKRQLYGIRDDRSVMGEGDSAHDSQLESAACMEFKCSGMLYDENMLDRTFVTVTVQGNCYLYDVNNELSDYLTQHPPAVESTKRDEFRMYAPVDPLGHSYGIYTVTHGNPEYAKKIALGRCFQGSSDTTSRVMSTQRGVALHYKCGKQNFKRNEMP